MDNLRDYATHAHINLSDKELQQFEVLLHELIKWNEITNLTAITTPDEVITKHFIDSLSVAQAIPENAKLLIDIGSGAGFPGIPLKIALPHLHVTLLESVGKKTAFHKHIIKELNLKDIVAVHARAEELGVNHAYRESYDVVTARAVARLQTLAEYALPLLKIGGTLIAQKITSEAEIEDARNALETLGGEIETIVPIEIPGLPVRHLIVIKKIARTPKEFPRKPGVAKHSPL